VRNRGNFQIVHEIRVDCDQDAIVLASSSAATAACHEGYAVVFFPRWYKGEWKSFDKRKSSGQIRTGYGHQAKKELMAFLPLESDVH